MSDLTASADPFNAPAIYANRITIDEFLKKVEAEVDSHVPDLSTEKGRKAIASLAYKVSQTKSAAEKARLALTADLRARVDEVNDLGKVVTGKLEELRDKARKPLTEWEAIEDARVNKCKSDISLLKLALTYTADIGEQRLSENLNFVQSMVIEMPAFADFLDEGRSAQASAIEHLTRQISVAKQLADQAAELARMKAEQAERDQAEAERVAKEAAAKAEQERIEREEAEAQERKAAEDERIRIAAEQAKKAAEEKAEKERQEAAALAEKNRLAELAKVEAEKQAEIERIQKEERAAREAAEAESLRKQKEAEAETQRLRDAEISRLAEVARLKAEADKVAAADSARQLDAANRARVRNEAISDFFETCGIAPDVAGKVFDAIAVGIISHLSVKF